MIKYSCSVDGKMKRDYNNTLEIIYQTDPDLANIIRGFVEGFPSILNDKINAGRKKGTACKDSKQWNYEENGNQFMVSLGKKSSSYKDYMSLYLKGIPCDMLKNWPRFEGEKLIGYVTLYLYEEKGHRGTPLQVTYNFYAKKVEKSVLVTTTTNVNGAFKDNAERLALYGLSEIHEKIGQGYYKIDTDKILKDNKR